MTRSTEYLAREVMAGQTMEIMGLVNPTNDDHLAPWMMALDRAQRLVGTIQVVCDAIAARPALIVTLNPAEDALLDEMSARDAEAMPRTYAPDPFYHSALAEALDTVRPREEAS